MSSLTIIHCDGPLNDGEAGGSCSTSAYSLSSQHQQQGSQRQPLTTEATPSSSNRQQRQQQQRPLPKRIKRAVRRFYYKKYVPFMTPRNVLISRCFVVLVMVIVSAVSIVKDMKAMPHIAAAFGAMGGMKCVCLAVLLKVGYRSLVEQINIYEGVDATSIKGGAAAVNANTDSEPIDYLTTGAIASDAATAVGVAVSTDRCCAEPSSPLSPYSTNSASTNALTVIGSTTTSASSAMTNNTVSSSSSVTVGDSGKDSAAARASRTAVASDNEIARCNTSDSSSSDEPLLLEHNTLGVACGGGIAVVDTAAVRMRSAADDDTRVVAITCAQTAAEESAAAAAAPAVAQHVYTPYAEAIKDPKHPIARCVFRRHPKVVSAFFLLGCGAGIGAGLYYFVQAIEEGVTPTIDPRDDLHGSHLILCMRKVVCFDRPPHAAAEA